MKTCTKCGVTKGDHDFGKRKGGDGLKAWCKCCKNADNARYRAANREKYNEAKSAWRIANPEKAKAATARWKAANPDRVRAHEIARNPEKRRQRDRNYRAENSEKLRAQHSAWITANLDKCRVYTQNRRARLSAGKLSVDISVRLLRKQKGRCACGCGQPLGSDYHLDHIMPLALGGTNTDDNVQLLRKLCNLQKHAKHPVDFMQSRGFLL